MSLESVKSTLPPHNSKTSAVYSKAGEDKVPNRQYHRWTAKHAEAHVAAPKLEVANTILFASWPQSSRGSAKTGADHQSTLGAAHMKKKEKEKERNGWNYIVFVVYQIQSWLPCSLMRAERRRNKTKTQLSSLLVSKLLQLDVIFLRLLSKNHQTS